MLPTFVNNIYYKNEIVVKKQYSNQSMKGKHCMRDREREIIAASSCVDPEWVDLVGYGTKGGGRYHRCMVCLI